MKINCAGGLFEGPIDESACLACALQNVSPPCGFSYPLLKGLYHSFDDRSQEVHVTDINTCLRKSFYSKRDQAPVYPGDLINLMVGKAVHQWLEIAMKDDPHFKSEAEVEHSGLTGRIDFVGSEAIIDLKTTSFLTGDKSAHDDHSDQLNVYNMMQPGDHVLMIQYLDKAGPSTCRSCRIALRLVDGQFRCPKCGYVAERGHNGAVIAPVESRDQELVEEWAMTRKIILNSSLSTGEPPDPEPGWICRYCPYSQCPEHGRE